MGLQPEIIPINKNHSPIRNALRILHRSLSLGSSGWAIAQLILMISVTAIGITLIGPTLIAIISSLTLLTMAGIGFYRQSKKHEDEKNDKYKVIFHYGRFHHAWRYIKSGLGLGSLGWSISFITIALLICFNLLPATTLVAGMLTGTVLLVAIGIFLSSATIGILLKKFKISEEINREFSKVGDTVNQIMSRFHILTTYPDMVPQAMVTANKQTGNLADAEPLLATNPSDLSDPAKVTIPLLSRYSMSLPLVDKPLSIVFLSRETLAIILRAIGFGSIGFTLGRLIFNGLLVNLLHLTLPALVVTGAPIAMGVCLLGLAAYFKYHKVIHQIVAKKLIELASQIETKEEAMRQTADKSLSSTIVNHDTQELTASVNEYRQYAALAGDPVILHRLANPEAGKASITKVISTYGGKYQSKEITGSPPTSASQLEQLLEADTAPPAKKTI